MKYNRPYVDGLFYLKLLGILIFRNYQFLVALLHFQAVSYDPVYMQREQFRKVFHLTNLKEGCFSSCHASGTNRKNSSLTPSVWQLFLCLTPVKDKKYFSFHYRVQNSPFLLFNLLKQILLWRCFTAFHCSDIQHR